jgi:DnaJ-class molecular chaperone
VQWGRARPRQSRGADAIGQLPITFGEAALGTRKTIRMGGGDTIDVAVPPGVEDGGRLRVPGKGGAAPGAGGVPGDLYLDLEVRADPHLRRAGDDIELDLPVTISEAVLGARVQVPTVEGPVTVTIPPGTSSGARLRLRGRGIKHADGTRGDQIVRVEIVAPKIKADDTETRKLFEQIAERTAQTPVRRF